ncbi:MAG: hypothetical protein ACTS10_16540 [Kiloniellales bacterium]
MHILATLLVVCVTGLCWARDGLASADCAGVLDDTARLACYDAAYRTAGQGAPRWSFYETTSALNDRREVEVAIVALAPFEDRFGALVRASLHLACRDANLQVWVHFGGAYFSEHTGGAVMTYRLDEALPRQRDFDIAEDRRSLGFWTSRAAGIFLTELQGSRSLVVRATPFRTNEATAVFDVTGLPGVLSQVREACAQ